MNQFQCVCVCVCVDLWTNFSVCVFLCVGFPTPTSRLQIPTEYLKIQLNSDAVYIEIESDSTGKRLSPTRPPSAVEANHKPRSPVLLTKKPHVEDASCKSRF